MEALASRTRDHLLANREFVSLERARTYLASRVRTRTPLGASEFLMAIAPVPRGYSADVPHDPPEERKAYDERVKLALDLMEIYRQLFPEHYARSSAPYFSTQREHQFFRLVHNRENFFPLAVHEEIDLLDILDAEPGFCLPYIPVRGMQQHTWQPGEFEFDEVGLCFQLALSLAWVSRDGEAWQALSRQYGLHAVSAPAPPLAAVGWTQFVHSCAVEVSPLRFLPLAFDMISYKTGNVWLDLPKVGAIGIEWSLAEMARLSIAWSHAKDCDLAIVALHNYLIEDPPARVGRAVELWNNAARVEEQSGMQGVMVEELIETGQAIPLGNERCLIRGGLLQLEGAH